MHFLNTTIISASDATSQTSSIIPVELIVQASLQAYFGDSTAAGSLSLQVSNEEPINISPPTHFAEIANVTVTAGATVIIPAAIFSYRFMRAVYTSTTPGTTTITVNLMAQYP